MTNIKYVSLSSDTEPEGGVDPAQYLNNDNEQKSRREDDYENGGNSYSMSNLAKGDEQESMLPRVRGEEEDTIVELEEDNWIDPEDYKPAPDERPYLCRKIAIIVILVLAVIAYAMYGTSSNSESALNGIQFDDFVDGSYRPRYKELEWSTSSDDDGVYIYRDADDNIVLEHIAEKSKKILVDGKDIVDPYGEKLEYFSFSVSSDSEYVLLGTNQTKHWRHSRFANYWIFNLTSNKTFPLTKALDSDHQAVISYAEWSPEGHHMAFVKDNDLYVHVDLTDERRVTFDGTPDVFNGVPDWIYEEEVLQRDCALWWSPNGTRIAYLRFNESEVPEYKFPLYMGNILGESYPEEVVMRYPKAGFPNPLVTLHIYDIETPLTAQSEAIPFKDDFEEEDKLITEVTWAGDNHILVRTMNRIQDIQRVVLVNTLSRKGTTIREENAELQDGGWFEISQSMVYIPTSSTRKKDSYIDLVNNNGYNHLAIFSLDSPNATFLTGGEWEVVDGIDAIDYDNEIIYYTSTEKSSIERHLYSINFDGTNKIALTPTDKPGYYEVDFSPAAKYYNLKYEGPDLPWQKVLKIGDPNFEITLEDNEELKSLLETKKLPSIRYLTVESEGYELNALEVRPAGMDDSGRTKYPVLFRVYGGPCSQLVNKKFVIDWHTYLTSKKNMKYIVVIVDTRGTGFRGRAFRVGVRTRLGELETEDVVNAGKYWCGQKYVDCNRIAIWGWSYGGYLTSKVIEADSGVFKVGISVAPVTDWRFYDSIYTERYMKTPKSNQDGYLKSAVLNMTGFDHVKFLLAHGTGDDNVHFQNTAVLIDRLTMASVHNYRVQFFTDSDHNIAKDNAYRELYELMTKFLEENFG